MNKVARILACTFLLLAATQPARGGNEISGQLCWTIGRFDDAVYFAGIEGREDRSASFASLIEISGIDAFPATCSTLPAAEYHALRAFLVKEWRDAELEVIDTTFLSDLDY